MQVSILQYSEDQAEAFDTISEALQRSGVDIEESMTTPRSEGGGSTLAVIDSEASPERQLRVLCRTSPIAVSRTPLSSWGSHGMSTARNEPSGITRPEAVSVVSPGIPTARAPPITTDSDTPVLRRGTGGDYAVLRP